MYFQILALDEPENALDLIWSAWIMLLILKVSPN